MDERSLLPSFTPPMAPSCFSSLSCARLLFLLHAMVAYHLALAPMSACSRVLELDIKLHLPAPLLCWLATAPWSACCFKFAELPSHRVFLAGAQSRRMLCFLLAVVGVSPCPLLGPCVLNSVAFLSSLRALLHCVNPVCRNRWISPACLPKNRSVCRNPCVLDLVWL
jgi:hypothetical protein